jgi:hypothetical protein
MSLRVTKADGTQEFFKIEKLRRSLRRAGATIDEINDIVNTVTSELFDGITTQDIYRRAFSELQNGAEPVAARYSVRRALFNLGPTGFPFELFLARLFALDGYHTKTGLIIQGQCAHHEIDIAAYKEGHSFVGEAKFHARPGTKSDLQVAMYSFARLLDLQDQKICADDDCGIKEFWLITNTKFTTTAQRYAECVGIKLLSWDYPKHRNLHDRIEAAGVYPITVLPSLSTTQAATLIAHGVLLCSDMLSRPHVLRHLHVSSRKQESILAEAAGVCHVKTSVPVSINRSLKT